jgi:hypothetical protein
MTKYNSNFDKTYPFTDTSVRFALATNVAQTYTVPGTNEQKYRAIFSYASNSNVIVGLNATATVPGAGTNQTTQTMEYKPKARYVKGGDVISAITPDASAYCGVSLWLLPT